MYTLVAFATQWGSKHGGINSFNADFLTAFGVAYHHSVKIICIVANHTENAKDEAAKANVQLFALPYVPEVRSFNSSIGEAGVDLLKKHSISFDPNKTIWLGHDLITGEAAVRAAKVAGGCSAVIHHMSYSDYESYAEDSQSAHIKTERQSAILHKAELVLAVGPLLRDAASDRLSGSKPVHMLIPGLAEIDSREASKTFVVFLSGRLSEDAARIKQAHLGIAAFARAEQQARDYGSPEALRRQPKLILRGVDFDDRLSNSLVRAQTDAEAELKKFAEQYAKAVINLQTLPYTEDRHQLYSELSRASVALMPSWHEGFGLVAWEAIAAGIPLIIGQNTGVYRFLEEEYPGAETGYVQSLDLRAATDFPYFQDEDLVATVNALKAIANDPVKARKKASTLRNMLLEKNSWSSCAEQAVSAFGWDLQKGSIGDLTPETVQQIAATVVSATQLESADLGPLRIPQGQWNAQAGMADSQLLRAEEALLPFDTARQPEVDKLREWVNDPKWPISVRLITGAGGQGKTRLAIHVCQQLKEIGWHAGFLDSNLEVSRMKSIWQDLRRLNRPVLIVVDYAETRQAAFLSLLKAALEHPTQQFVRMLLLARDGGEWWDNLPSKDPQCEALLSGYATTGPFRLSPLYATQQDRRHGFTKALQAFAEILGVPRPEISTDLVGEHFERPLFVQMAALLALYGERPITAQGLTKALLNHERRYWEGLLAPFNWPEPARRAEQLLALATLAGGFATSRIGESFWKRARGPVLSTGDFNSLFRNMATLYPGTQGLQALRPDLLGEALVAQALLRPEGDVLLDAVLSSSATQLVRRNALTVLARISNERVDVDETLIAGLSRQFGNCGADLVAVSAEIASRLPELAELAFERLSSGMKSQVAGLLTKSLEDESVQLEGVSCLVFGYLAEKARERFEKKPSNVNRLVEYSLSLDSYGVHLAFKGDYKHACEVAENGLEVFHRLSARDQRHFEGDYAILMANYSTALYRAGRIEEARDFGRTAVEIYERLAKENPDRFEPNYAGALTNYASRLADFSPNDEALKRGRDALEIFKRLAEKDPDRFEADYAASMGNYAIALSDAENTEAALEYMLQVVATYRRLSHKLPDRFQPSYATSLNNYANYLSDLGQNEEALRYAREALEIRKQLAQKNPDRFESDYATSLNNSAAHSRDLGQNQEALQQAREALEIRKRLAQQNPDRFEPAYATSLSNYAGHLSDLGQNQEALQHARDALEINKRLVQKNRDRFATNLFVNTCFMHFLAWLCHKDDGWNQEALDKIFEYIQLHEQPLMLLYSAFLEACLATARESRRDKFRKVLSKWNNLRPAAKQDAEPYRLCAAAWCAKFDSLEQSDWLNDWQQYSTQRHGHIPQWMLEVARRLEFQFPD